jgi:hypothetical protein
MPILGPTTDHLEIRHWAESHKAVPTELLPQTLDHIPAVLRLMFPQMAADRKDIRILTWEEFFAKFDLLGLTFIYDTAISSGYNELLQIDARSPYRSPADALIDRNN